MRFLPTLNIWDQNVVKAIETGQIKIQVGQWVTCGSDNDYKARFISQENGYWNVVHKSPNCGRNFKFRAASQADNLKHEKYRAMMDVVIGKLEQASHEQVIQDLQSEYNELRAERKTLIDNFKETYLPLLGVQ